MNPMHRSDSEIFEMIKVRSGRLWAKLDFWNYSFEFRIFTVSLIGWLGKQVNAFRKQKIRLIFVVFEFSWAAFKDCDRSSTVAILAD